MRVIGINHDVKSDGTGKAGLTFQFKNLLNNNKMNPSATNVGGWGASALRNSMNSGAIWGTVPPGLQEAIAPVMKEYCPTRTSTSFSDVASIEDTLFIASLCELAGDVPSNCGTAWVNAEWLNAEGSQYEYWKKLGVNVSDSTKCAAFKKGLQSNPSASVRWWERSVSPDNDVTFARVDTGGYPCFGNDATNLYGVCPCFCL